MKEQKPPAVLYGFTIGLGWVASEAKAIDGFDSPIHKIPREPYISLTRINEVLAEGGYGVIRIVEEE